MTTGKEMFNLSHGDNPGSCQMNGKAEESEDYGGRYYFIERPERLLNEKAFEQKSR